MKHIKHLFLYFSLAMLFACASTPDISRLSPSPKAKTFTLNKVYVWKQTWGPEFALANGEYVAEQENELGTLFRGPPRCVAYQITRGYVVTSGGVWIPKNSQEQPRLYTYAYLDELEVRDRDIVIELITKDAIKKSAGLTSAQTVSGAQEQTLPEKRKIVVTSPVALSPTQAGLASGLGTGVVNAIAAYEITQNSGKPFLQWKIENPELRFEVQDK